MARNPLQVCWIALSPSISPTLGSISSPNQQNAIPIELAIKVAQHLGIKSESCLKLYSTALVIADLRRYQKVRIFASPSPTSLISDQVENIPKIIEALGRVKSLKSSDMFAVIAAPEIEEAFIQVSTHPSFNAILCT
jgi:hypothetical protein